MALRSPNNFEDRHPRPAADPMVEAEQTLIDTIHDKADELGHFSQEIAYHRIVRFEPEPGEQSCSLETIETISGTERQARFQFYLPYGGNYSGSADCGLYLGLAQGPDTSVQTIEPKLFTTAGEYRVLDRISDNPSVPFDLQALASLLRHKLRGTDDISFDHMWRHSQLSLDSLAVGSHCRTAYYHPAEPAISVVTERHLDCDDMPFNEYIADTNLTIFNLPDGARYARHTANGRVSQYRYLQPDVSYASPIIRPSHEQLAHVSTVLGELIGHAYTSWVRQ